MATNISTIGFRAASLGNLAEILRLIAGIRGIGDLTSPDGLRQAIELVLRLGQLVGLDEQFIERLRAILANQDIFEIVLAITRYLMGVISVSGETDDRRIEMSTADGQIEGVVTLRGFVEWLPIVLQIIDIVRQLLEAFRTENRS